MSTSIGRGLLRVQWLQYPSGDAYIEYDALQANKFYLLSREMACDNFGAAIEHKGKPFSCGRVLPKSSR